MWTHTLATVGIVALLLGAEIGAEVSITSYATRRTWWLMAIGVALYLAIPFLFLWLMRTQKNLTVANTVWQAGNIFIVGLLGWLVLKETLSAYQFVGIGLALVATVLVMIQPKKKGGSQVKKNGAQPHV